MAASSFFRRSQFFWPVSMSSSCASDRIDLHWNETEPGSGIRYALVQLHNPERLNAMSVSMWRQLKQVFTDIQQQPDVRCVVVAGAGGNFCAGGDISEYARFRFEIDSLRSFHEDDVWGGLGAMLACDVPMIAHIDGVCMGAGLEIASCCDIRMASASSQFGAPIAKLGFPMAPRELQLVGQAVGDTVARQILLEAAVLRSDDMLRTGFLSEVVADSTALQARVEQKTVRILALSPQAARLNKQTLRALAQGHLAQSLETAYDYASSTEHREGIEAFVQKRKPSF